MEFPLNTKVECTDGLFGRSEYVLINPVINQVTHLVVKEDKSPNTEYLVPVKFVNETIIDLIRLSCNKAELEKMDPFISTTFIEETVPERDMGAGGKYVGGSYYYLPYVTAEKTTHEFQQIPAGELAVRRGTRIEAMDGYVGKVDEFLVNPENCMITHLVMREGILWGKKEVVIPLSAIVEDTRDEVHEDTVLLKLDKHQVESLPGLPLHRSWS